MKSFVPMIVALGFAVSIAVPTFAADAPKDKDSCEKAGMVWDDATKTCKPKE
jgi:ABC-type proline/glycine betaine transport system substrate-binding protein